MWTTGIFLGISLAGVGFLLWFLFGLIREQIRESRRTLMPRAWFSSGRERQLLLPRRHSAGVQAEHSVTVRLVWRTGANAQ